MSQQLLIIGVILLCAGCGAGSKDRPELQKAPEPAKRGDQQSTDVDKREDDLRALGKKNQDDLERIKRREDELQKREDAVAERERAAVKAATEANAQVQQIRKELAAKKQELDKLQNSLQNPDAVKVCEQGEAAIKKSDSDLAMSCFEEAIRLDPKCAAGYCGRGLAHSNKSEWDKAIVDLSEAVRLKPDYAEAYYRRGGAYVSKGGDGASVAGSEVILGYKKAIIAGDVASQRAAIAAITLYQRAVADFTEAIRLDPNRADAYCGRGEAHRSMTAYDDAITDFTEAIRLNPKLVRAYWGRSLAYSTKGEVTKAKADEAEAGRILKSLEKD